MTIHNKELQSLPTFFAPLVLSSTLAFAASSSCAQSMRIDHCYDIPTATALLKKDKQNNVAQAYEVDGADTARRFFSNEDGTLGYELKGNLPFLQKQTEYCVKEILTNVAILSRSLGSPPVWLGARSGDGKTSTDLVKSYALGGRFVLIAQTLAEKDGKLFKSDKMGVIIREDGAGTLEQIKLDTGETMALYVLRGFTLTQHAERLAARREQTQTAR